MSFRIEEKAISQSCISTRFGPVLIESCDNQISSLSFTDQEDSFSIPDREHFLSVRQILDGTSFKTASINLLALGSEFDIDVWTALLSIPEGGTASYEQVASRIGRSAAVRATANAIGRNPIAYFIPCHRVIRKNGGLGGYRWGTRIKEALLQIELRRIKKEGPRLSKCFVNRLNKNSASIKLEFTNEENS